MDVLGKMKVSFLRGVEECIQCMQTGKSLPQDKDSFQSI